MMEWLVVEDVGVEYVPMMLADLELDGRDHDRPAPPAGPASDARAEFPVVVVGCGSPDCSPGSGCRRRASRSRSSRRTPASAGRGWENRYPGARVDVGNHFYCFSFEPSDRWTEFFAQQPELQAYFQGSWRSTGIEAHVRFRTEVVSATWDEPSAPGR